MPATTAGCGPSFKSKGVALVEFRGIPFRPTKRAGAVSWRMEDEPGHKGQENLMPGKSHASAKVPLLTRGSEPEEKGKWAGKAAVGTALICMEGLRLFDGHGQKDQIVLVGTALICMEGLRLLDVV